MMDNDNLRELMPMTSAALEGLIHDINSMGELNIALIVALHRCRTVLDEIWFNDQADKEDHALWAVDQRAAIAMADAVMAKVRA